MATYKQIQAWVQPNHGLVPETCWIADAKSPAGLPMWKAPNRIGPQRVKPCPPDKLEPIRAALRHLGMV